MYVCFRGVLVVFEAVLEGSLRLRPPRGPLKPLCPNLLTFESDVARSWRYHSRSLQVKAHSKEKRRKSTSKRGKKIKDAKELKEYNEILDLSICHHFKQINNNMDTILSDVCNDEEYIKVTDKIHSEKEKLGYKPNEILLMKKVVDTFYKHEKYYLD